MLAELKGKSQFHTLMEAVQTDNASWKWAWGQFGKTINLKLLLDPEILLLGIQETEIFMSVKNYGFTDSTLFLE